MLPLCLPDSLKHSSVIPTRYLSPLISSLGLPLPPSELAGLASVVDPQSVGSVHLSTLTTALVNLLTAFNRSQLESSLRALDVDEDGLLHGEELTYLIDTFGEPLTEWQRHKMQAIVEKCVDSQGAIDCEELVEQTWMYGRVTK